MDIEIKFETADGRPVLLRPMTAGDEPALRRAIDSFSNRTRYLRFFTGAAQVPEGVIQKLVHVDGASHLAWVAIDESVDGGRLIGAAHVMREDLSQPLGELAIGLVDDWQGRGISRRLIAHLSAEAAATGVTTLQAHVLYENPAGRALVKALGAVSKGADGSVSRFHINIADMLEKLAPTTGVSASSNGPDYLAAA